MLGTTCTGGILALGIAIGNHLCTWCDYHINRLSSVDNFPGN